MLRRAAAALASPRSIAISGAMGESVAPMASTSTPQRDLLIAWTRQCFQAAGLEASEQEAHSYAAIAAAVIVDEGFVQFAEGNSFPHGSGSHTVAGGHPVPGFIAYLRSWAPGDAAGKLDGFDEIFQRFVDLTATAEAAGESGALSNAAYNRSLNAAHEIVQQFFEARTADTVQQLHRGFGDRGTAAIDMSKVSIGTAAAGGGCAVAALALMSAGALIGLLVASWRCAEVRRACDEWADLQSRSSRQPSVGSSSSSGQSISTSRSSAAFRRSRRWGGRTVA